MLDQIKADREQKKAAAAAARGEASTTVAAPTPKPAAVVAPPRVDYTEAKIQVPSSHMGQLRMPGGSALVQTFGAAEPLSAVRLFAQLKNAPDIEVVGETAKLYLKTSHPRKTFSEEDMHTPLNVLGLVPSAVVIVSNAP